MQMQFLLLSEIYVPQIFSTSYSFRLETKLRLALTCISPISERGVPDYGGHSGRPWRGRRVYGFALGWTQFFLLPIPCLSAPLVSNLSR